LSGLVEPFEKLNLRRVMSIMLNYAEEKIDVAVFAPARRRLIKHVWRQITNEVDELSIFALEEATVLTPRDLVGAIRRSWPV
jgi:hypothetical protein